ncbi:hypothetical protein AB0D04_11660 [Streptomyces sp. NPDC048483]|uniref:hypothetical protein n=1 Tax=Streptomyces sp. NPDC048483 TaxID=3154927 RepID=UPI00343A7F07
MPNDTDPEAVIRALDNVGVDFSIPKSALADFLGNAEFTPYPAIAAALLKVLNGRMLQRPVFLDVIVFNYEHSPGNPSPRQLEDVDIAVLEAAVLEGFNNRYAREETNFSSLLKPQNQPQPPLQTLSLVVEGFLNTQDGVTFVDTDNPQVEVATKLIKVNAEWAQGMVPQELIRQDNGWRFTNGDARLSVSNGEAEAGLRPVRAGSLSDSAYAWPAAGGTFSGEAGAEVRMLSRIRVGYRPVDVKLLVEAPKNGFAANSAEKARIALDPQVLLVPVEVARFFSDQIPVSNISMPGQMALWDQVPIVSGTTNFRSIDGSTAELRLAERAWDYWPTLDAEGLYTHLGWVSPDSIWGRAKIRFRLVNYIDIKTDNEHAAPVAGQGADDRRLRENNDALSNHPQHISDKRVLKVIFMHRIEPPDSPHPGRALVGDNCVGISSGASDKFAIIAHEIGHLIINSQVHSTQPNNVLNDPGPGTQVTDEQIGKARTWAQGFADFWPR